jgi:hypothetical protein
MYNQLPRQAAGYTDNSDTVKYSSRSHRFMASASSGGTHGCGVFLLVQTLEALDVHIPRALLESEVHVVEDDARRWWRRLLFQSLSRCN